MSSRVVFNLRSTRPRAPLPPKLILVQQDTESVTHLLLKLLGYLLFQRDRLLVEPRLEDDYLPFTPDLVELDYQGRIALWIECGECAVNKLDRLAVKAPYAHLWCIKRSPEDAAELVRQMRRHELRTGRYSILGLDPALLGELTALTQARNDVVWHRGVLDPPQLQLEYNGLWFESEFTVLHY